VSSDGGRLAEDAAARLRAQADFDTPLLVEAGAGSGKTSILVARIVAWALGPGWERHEARLLERKGEAPPDEVAGNTLSRVVAITFTEAAAADMAARVGHWLGRIAVGDDPEPIAPEALPAPELRRARAAPLRAALDRLVVRTIHAWCRRLLAERPLEVGLHPGFEVDADQERTARIVREVVEQAIVGAYPDPAAPLSRLAALRFGPAQIEAAVLALVLAGAEPALLGSDALSPERVAKLAARVAGGCRAFLAAGGEPLAGGGSRGRATVESVVATLARLEQGAPRDGAGLAAFLDELAALWDPKSIARLAQWSKQEFGKKEAAAVAGCEEAVAHAAGALRRCLAHALALDLARLELARRALEPLLGEVHTRLRRAGVETFAALLRDASRLVREGVGAAARIRRGIDQLLVDEFQDTDGLQCEIVERIGLSEGDAPGPTLFLVGDPRQSIYGWRSADLRAYDAFAAKIDAAGGARLRLTKNFRSLPAVLDEVKRSVARHMTPRTGVMPAFQDLVPHRRDGEGRVEHWVSWRWDAEAGKPARTRSREAVALEARAVAADVARLARNEGVAWSDVALLFRGLTDVDLYLDALRDAGVPYAVERDRRYYQRREVIEASALLRTVLDPHDHLALVAWLRSASVGVPDAAWTPLWARRFPEAMSDLRLDTEAALAPALEIVAAAAAAVDPGLPGLDRLTGWPRSLAHAVATLATLRVAAERDASDAFVERLRMATGIELTEASRYLGVYRAANLDQFFRDLRDDLEDAGWDGSEVLRRVRHAVEQQAEVEEARPRDAADEAVRVMSIHKSKGLDFPHVYLLQLHKGSAGNATAGAAVGRGEDGDEYALFGARSLGFDTADEQRQLTEEAERVRTLYVAMTRPCDRLVLVGKHASEGDRLGQSHAELIAPRRDAAVEVAVRMGRLAKAGESAERDADGVLWRFPGLEPEVALRRAAPPAAAGVWPTPEQAAEQSGELAQRRAEARARASCPHAQAASALSHEAAREHIHARRFPEDPAAAAVLAPGAAEVGEGTGRDRRVAAAVGTAVHAALERWDAGAKAPAALAAAARHAAGALSALVGEADREAAVADARAVLERFAASPLLARLREIDAHVLARELPVLCRPGPDDGALGHLVGTIDLLYRDPESGELVVADYKSDRVASERELRERAAGYAAQGGAYVRALREALALDAPPRFELWFLDRGACITVDVSGR